MIKKDFNKKDILGSFLIVGIKLEFINDFLPWLLHVCEDQDINLDLSSELFIRKALQQLLTKHNILKDVIWCPCYNLLLNYNKTHVILGRELECYDENYSMKRCKIEFFDDFMKMGLFVDQNEYKFIQFYSDVIFKGKVENNDQREKSID